MSWAIGALLCLCVLCAFVCVYSLCAAAGRADRAAAAIFENEMAPGKRLDEFMEWQHATMLRATLANDQLCGGPQTVHLDQISEAAAAIRRNHTKPGPLTADEEAACTDATLRWCAYGLGYQLK
jgi:hypothetical protein